MKKTLLKSLMFFATIAPALVWSDVVYQASLAGSDTSLVVEGVPYKATSYSVLTTLEEDGTNKFNDVIQALPLTENANWTCTSTHTFSTWIKVDSLTDDKILWWACGGHNGEHGGYAVKVMSDGKIRVGKANADGAWNGTNYRTTTGACLTANTWAYVTVVIDADNSDTNHRYATPTVYVNGTAKAMDSGTFPTNLNGAGGAATYVQMGAGVTAAGVRVDNVVLTAAEVTALNKTGALVAVPTKTATWTPTDATSSFDTADCWDIKAIPSEEYAITIDTSTYTEDISVVVSKSYAELTVKGNADKLTTISFAEGKQVSSVSIEGLVAFPYDLVMGNATTFVVDDNGFLVVDIDEDMTANENVTNKWNFAKAGTGTLTLTKQLTGGKKLRVLEGTLKFNGQANGNYSANIKIDEGAILRVDNNNANYNPVSGSGTIVNDGSFVYSSTAAGEGCHLWATMSGSGKVVIEKGTYQIHGTNTYTGGTEILAGAKLIAETDAVGTGAISGAGTLQMNNYPSQTTVRASMGNAEKWTGRFVNTGDLTLADTGDWFGLCGNENSSYELTGTSSGYLKQAGSCDATLIISGSITLNNGYSSNGGYTFNGALSGNGTFAVENDNIKDVIQFLGETKDFAGTITVAGGHCVSFGEQDDDDSGIGKLLIQPDKVANIVAGKTWSAEEGIEVSGTLSGAGTVSSALVYKSGATIDVTAGQILTATGAVTLPTDTINVRLGAMTALDVKLLSATNVSTEMPMATVKIGDEVITTVRLEKHADGLYLPMEQIFTRTFDGTATTWEAMGAWGIKGATLTADSPMDQSIVELTVEADTIISHGEKIHLEKVDLEGEGDLILEFDLSAMMEDDDYLASPYTIQLLEVNEGFDPERVQIWTKGVKYGATVRLTTTETTVSATIRLPDSMIIDYEYGASISINFKGDGDYAVSGDDPVGVAGFEVLPQFWSQFGNTEESNFDLLLLEKDGETTTTLSEIATSYSCANTYSTRDDSSHSILRGYIDDGNNRAKVGVEMPADWDEYTAIIYCATDSGNTTFGPKQVNGMWYSYDARGVLVSSTDRSNSSWGDSDSRSNLIVGTNVMIVEGLSGDFTLFSNRWQGTGPRGCVAAVQLFQKLPVYDLSLAPKVYTATLTTDTTWANITWTLNGEETTEKPTAEDIVELTLNADISLDVTDLAASQVTVVGRNHTLRLDNVLATDETPWVFDANTTVVFDDETSVMPQVVTAAPGRFVYNYVYKKDYTALAGCITEFAKGFVGTLTRPAGTVTEFSGGEAHITIADQAETGDIIFSGDVAVTRMIQAGRTGDEFGLGNYEVVVKDNATVTTSMLILLEGNRDYTAHLILEDHATVYVTGTKNVDSNQASIMVGHWPGNSTLTVRDNARLIAEGADILIGKTAGDQTINVEGGEVRARGVMLASYASGINTLNLTGGKLLVGEGGFGRYGNANTLHLICDGGALGATADITLGTAFRALLASFSGAPIFDGTATLTLADMTLFSDETIIEKTIDVQGGTLVLDHADFAEETYAAFNLTGGKLMVTMPLEVKALNMSGASTLSFDGATVTVTETMSIADGVAFEIPFSSDAGASGYLIAGEDITLGDFSKLTVILVLDADRDSTSRIMPKVPIALGAYDETSKVPQAVALYNNSNNAIDETSMDFELGTLGEGLYITLTGAEVLSSATVNLTNESATVITQTNTSNFPYLLFNGTATSDNLLTFEGDHVKAYQMDFIGGDTVLQTTGTTPAPLMQLNGLTIGTNVTFDLTSWKEVIEAQMSGAVKGMPLSYCLASGGVSLAPGKTVTVDAGLDEDELATYGLKASVEVTADGIYYVLQGESRRTRSVSMNFTNASTPLVAPPAMIGAYPISMVGWNSLATSYSTPELHVAMKTGSKDGLATRTVGETEKATRIVCSTAASRTDDASILSLLKVWPNDAGPVTFTIENIPFEQYRLALIYSADIAGAAFACATINGQQYAMDAEGYTRTNIKDYVELTAAGKTKLYVAGDHAWGRTKRVTEEDADINGVNTLITDVFTTTDDDCTAVISLPALVYNQVYAGVAALQIVEVPALEAIATEAKTYSTTFENDVDVKLMGLDLDVNGTTNTEKWTSGAACVLHLTVEEGKTAAVTLPNTFEASTIKLSGQGAFILSVEGDGAALIATLDASEAKDVTVNFPCAGVDFKAPSGVARFEKAFDNKGETYTIAAGAVLALGEHSGITTQWDTNLPSLDVDANSTGTLRRDYPVTFTQSQGSGGTLDSITHASRKGVFHDTYWQRHLLIEEGDTFTTGTNMWVTGNNIDRTTVKITQTGGTFTMADTTIYNNGLLFGPAGASAWVDGDIDISGGVLHTSGILAWDSDAQVTVDVTGASETQYGTLSLYNQLRTNSDGAKVAVTMAGYGTLNLANTQLVREGSGTITLTFNGGRLTTSQAEATLNVPATFAGTATAPTRIDAGMSTIVLGTANTKGGTGDAFVEVASGTLAVTNANALGTPDNSVNVTVKAGAAYEVRGLAADAALAGHLTFEDGSTIIINNTAITGGTVRIARSISFTDASEVSLLLNGVYTSFTVADAENGTITLGTAVTFDDVTWDAAKATGIWQDQTSGPWVDSNKIYKNGAAVTFPVKTHAEATTAVTVTGTVKPGALTFASGVSNSDGYVFTGSGLMDLALCGSNLNLASSVIFDVPVRTAANAVLTGTVNTYRLIGAMPSETVATLVGSGNLNADSNNHGTWCTDGVTLAPCPGETQRVSASGDVFAKGRSHLSGSEDVLIVGGGTVEFAGSMNAGDTDVPFQNKAFSGKIRISEGSTLDVTMSRTEGRDNHAFFALTQNYNGTDQSSEPSTGIPRWVVANEDEPQVGLIVEDGATFRVSGCRSIYGGWEDRDHVSLLKNTPISIGHDATVTFAYTGRIHHMPYGMLFNGDNATMEVGSGAKVYAAAGTRWMVNGIGDAGDTTDTASVDDAGLLTTGIRAQVKGLFGFYQPLSMGSALILDVHEASTLAWMFDVTSAHDIITFPEFAKEGSGRLSMEIDTLSHPLKLAVNEGVVGGHTAITHATSQVSVAAGVTIEAGLSMTNLSLAKEETVEGETRYATIAIDPTGTRLLQTNSVVFTEAATYKLEVLSGSKIPTASNQLPVKVVGWTSAQNADAATFILADALVDAGYGLLVRNDGLYLAKQVVYEREIKGVTGLTSLVNQKWYTKEWTRSDDPSKTLVDYAPVEGEAVIARWIIKDATEIPATLIMQFELAREVEFSEIQIVRALTGTTGGSDDTSTEDTTDDTTGGTTTVYEPVTASVTYVYNLADEAMPVGNEVVTFTWVPTLLVNKATAEVKASGYDASTYATAISKATVTIYTDSSSPVLNVSFGEAYDGDTAWLSENSAPCGAVPFAGAYWNNVSTRALTGQPQGDDGVMLYSTTVKAQGVKTDADAEIPMRFAASASHTVLSRTNTPNGVLTATYISGEKPLPETLIDKSVNAAWMVQFNTIPFKTYEIYVIFAGGTDNAGAYYMPVSMKVGDDPWRTFSYRVDEAHGSWTAPSAVTALWAGLSSPADGDLIHGQHYLRMRVSAEGSRQPLVLAGNVYDSTFGLAAIQVIECEDGPEMYATKSGDWSGSSAWAREGADGEKTTGVWIDATEETPRPAVLENVSMVVDKPATMPYLQVKGSAGTTVSGVVDYLRTSVLDLTCATGTVAFEDEVFVTDPTVILGTSQTISVPEVDSGEIENTWDWVSYGTITSALKFHKKLAGDLVLKNFFQGALAIDYGTLWLDVDQNVTLTNGVTGAGTLGKRGSGTMTLNRDNFELTSETPLIVEDGTFTIETNFTAVGAGKTFHAKGGTIHFTGASMEQFKGIPANSTLLITEGGRVTCDGVNKFTNVYPTVIAENGTFEAIQNSINANSAPHIHCGPVTLRNGGEIYVNHNNGVNAWVREGLCVHGDLFVESGVARLRCLNNNNRNGVSIKDGYSLVVNGGATLNSHAAIFAANGHLIKKGEGTWNQTLVMFTPDGAGVGQPVTIEGGTLIYNLGNNNTHAIKDDVTVDCTITVKSGARLEGNVVFSEKAPVVIEEGATIASGVSGEMTSKITADTLTLEEGAIVECDFNRDVLTVTRMLTCRNELTVKLVNYGSSLTTARRVLACPTTMSTPPIAIADITSAEAIALDATFEWRFSTNADECGLWLIPANSAYKRTEGGKWSDEKWLVPADYDEADPEVFVAGKSARLDIAGATEIVADSNQANTQLVDALVMNVAAGQTFTLAAVTTEDSSTTPPTLVEDTTPLQLSALWKLGAGNARVTTPLKLVSADTVSVAGGLLMVTKPLDSNTTAPTFPVTISKDAKLSFNLPVGDDYQQYLSDKVSGAGTLEVLSGFVQVGTTAETSDHDLHYVVGNENGTSATLSLNQGILASTRTNARTVVVKRGGNLLLNTNRALGSTPNMTMTLHAGSTVTSSAPTNDYGAHLGGTIIVPATSLFTPAEGEVVSTATITGDVKVINDVTYQVEEGMTLDLTGQRWYVPIDGTPALKKDGAGTLILSGGYELADATFDIEAGVVRVASEVSASAGAPVMTVRGGATLDVARGIDLNAGSLTFEPNAAMVVSGGATIKGYTTLAVDTKVRFVGEPQTIDFTNLVVNGTATIELEVSPEDVRQTSFVLMKSTAGITGGGSFRLGGNNAADWIEAGWTLRQQLNQIELVSAKAEGTYTWGAPDGTTDWTGGTYWYESTEMTTPVKWNPAVETPYSAMLANKVMVKDENGVEAEIAVNRTLIWADTNLFNVTALRSDAMIETNEETGTTTDRGYTIRSISKPLNLMGEMVLTGTGTTTIDCPIHFNTNSASLSILQGKVLFTDVVQSSAELKRPIAMGEASTIEFATSRATTIGSPLTVLSNDESAMLGTFRNSGSGVLTFTTDVSKVKAFDAVNSGTIAMGQTDLFDVATPVTIAEKATFAFSGLYTGAYGSDDSIHVKVNAVKENADATAPTGTFKWAATTNAAVAKTPRLTRASGEANVETFSYDSKGGRLTLEADGFFPETATLALNTMSTESSALLLGKGVAGTTPAVVFGNVSGSGVVGVEPVLNGAAGDWSTNRVLTFKLLNGTTRFDGRLMGATTGGATITAGLALERSEGLTETPLFTYAGISNQVLGTFAVGEGVRAEIRGTWAGDVAVAPGALLTGGDPTSASTASTVIGHADATIDVPAGAAISAVNADADGDVPVVMPIAGTLKLETGSIVDVRVARDPMDDSPLVSCIEAEGLELPTTVAAGQSEVMLAVNLYLTENDLYATGEKILGWKTLNGYTKVNGTIKVYKDGELIENHGYYLRQQSDGLYITRSKARTWLIIR